MAGNIFDVWLSHSRRHCGLPRRKNAGCDDSFEKVSAVHLLLLPGDIVVGPFFSGVGHALPAGLFFRFEFVPFARRTVEERDECGIIPISHIKNFSQAALLLHSVSPLQRFTAHSSTFSPNWDKFSECLDRRRRFLTHSCQWFLI